MCVVVASKFVVFGLVLAMAVSLAFLALPALAVPLFLAAIALKKQMEKGPRVTRVDGENVELEIASDVAAAAIRKHAEARHERDVERTAERFAKARQEKAPEKAEAEPKPPSKAAASLAEWAKRRRH